MPLKREFLYDLTRKYTYRTKVVWREQAMGELTTSNGVKIDYSPCPEFGGIADTLTPTDALIAAVNICIQTTFISMATRLNFKVISYECETEGDIDDLEAHPRFTQIRVKPVVEVESGAGKNAEYAMDLAEKYCLVTNSLKTELIMEPEITEVNNTDNEKFKS